MRGQLRFALNHMAAPHAALEAFLDMASDLGVKGVEIRNDLPGRAIADGTPAAAVRAGVEQRGLRLLSINALQRFNDWTPDRAKQARALATYARDCRAEALVLCPVNDWSFRPAEGARVDGLRRALAELAPILSELGIIGLVEPLGFAESSLRLKREALETIDTVGGGEVFRLVHDTFHHAVAGENETFPERVGLVHISGVEAEDLALWSMRDSHRVFVGPDDRIGNVEQIRRLVDGGYAGFFSFEPFAESESTTRQLASVIAESMAFLTRSRKSEAA